MFPDPDDFSPRMDNQNFVIRTYYVHIHHLKNTYPVFKKFFGSLVNESNVQDYGYKADFNQHYNELVGTLDVDVQTGVWSKGKNIRIVEVFYKKNVKYFECIGLSKPDKNGVQNEIVFSTFYKEFAEKNALKGRVEIKDGTRIFKGVYCEDTLLEHGAILEQVPNQKYLPIVPMVLQRDFMGVPYGIIDDLIPRQDLKNLNMTTFMHYKDSKLIVGEHDNLDYKKYAEDWAKQSRMKNGSIFLSKNDNTQIINSSQNLEHDLALLNYIDNDWEKTTGFHDEYSGKINRETSGAAIQQVTLNSINAQNSLMLAYDHMIVSEGTLMLDTLKGTENINQLVKFYRLGKNESVQLNSEISMLNFEVYPDASPNFSSSVEEEKVLFNDICNSPNPAFYLNSNLFLKLKGFSDRSAFSISEEWRRVQIDQQKLVMEAQLEMQQQQAAMQQQNEQQLITQKTGNNNEE